jgi:O-antigen/teichoic acid export membrane protein
LLVARKRFALTTTVAILVGLFSYWAAGLTFLQAAVLGAAVYTGLTALITLQYCYALNRFKSASLLYGLSRVAAIGAAVVLAHSYSSPVVIFAASQITADLAFVLLTILSDRPRHADPRRSSRDHDSLRLAETVKYGFGSLANILINQSDAFLVSLFTTSSATGLYAAGSQLQNAVSTFPLAFVAPLMMETAQREQSGEPVAELARKSARLTVGIAAGAALLVAASLPLLPRVLGPSFRAAEGSTLVLMAAAPLTACAAVYLMVCIGRGRPHAVTLTWVVALAGTVIGHATITHKFGAIGAAITVLVIREPLLLSLAFRGARDSADGLSRGRSSP